MDYELLDSLLAGRILSIGRWETPASAYPRRRVGTAEVTEFIYEQDAIYQMYMTMADDGNRYDYYNTAAPLRITNLTIGGEVVMVDDPPHWFAMLEHASKYHGHILCAGLGLGLIVHALAGAATGSRPRRRASNKINKITVVERNKDVIELISPLLPALSGPTGTGSVGLEIVNEDWDCYSHPRSAEPVDGVFYDLFVGSGFSLIGQAASELVKISEQYPGAVSIIHGFNMDLLAAIATHIR